MFQNDEISVLMRLGLSFLQSKVYLTIVDLDLASIMVISKASNVARQELYRITAELENEGLLEKVISSPSQFRAIPLNEGLSILLQRRSRENRKLHKDALRLIRQSASRINYKKQDEPKPQFILIPEKETFIKKLRTAIESTTLSLHQVTTEKRFLQATHHFLGAYTGALNRGVAMKVIVELNDKEKALHETVLSLEKAGCFDLRRIPAPPKANIAIFDRRSAFVTVYPEAALRGSPAIMTDNPSFLAIYQDYFETAWKTAEEYDCKQSSQSEESVRARSNLQGFFLHDD